jgi:hypothetical protein
MVDREILRRVVVRDRWDGLDAIVDCSDLRDWDRPGQSRRSSALHSTTTHITVATGADRPRTTRSRPRSRASLDRLAQQRVV